MNDKVVCIDDSDNPRQSLYCLPNGRPAKGRVYAIGGLTRSNGEDGFAIVGFPAIEIASGIDRGFRQSRFRRLEHKITHGDYYCQRVIGGADSLVASDEDNRQPFPRLA